MKMVARNLKKKINPTGSDYSQLKSILPMIINMVNNNNNLETVPTRLTK